MDKTIEKHKVNYIVSHFRAAPRKIGWIGLCFVCSDLAIRYVMTGAKDSEVDKIFPLCKDHYHLFIDELKER